MGLRPWIRDTMLYPAMGFNIYYLVTPRNINVFCLSKHNPGQDKTTDLLRVQTHVEVTNSVNLTRSGITCAYLSRGSSSSEESIWALQTSTQLKAINIHQLRHLSPPHFTVDLPSGGNVSKHASAGASCGYQRNPSSVYSISLPRRPTVYFIWKQSLTKLTSKQ